MQCREGTEEPYDSRPAQFKLRSMSDSPPAPLRRPIRTWISRTLKLAVCVFAVWYLSRLVSLHDEVRIQASPTGHWRIIEQSPDSLTVRNQGTEEVRQLNRRDEPERFVIVKGMKSLVHEMDWRWTIWGVLIVGVIPFAIAWRLKILLAMKKIALGYRDAAWLTFGGNFFNFALPGTTMGDIYKAYHVASRTTHKTEAVAMIFIDRFVGLLSFLLLAVATLVLPFGNSLGNFAVWIGWTFVAAMIVGCAFFSERLRRLVRFESLIARLPLGGQIMRIDQTVMELRRRPASAVAALGISIATHLIMVTSAFMVARGLGIAPNEGRSGGELYAAVLVAVIVGYLLAAVPISYQGIGILEAVFIRVLIQGGWCSYNQMLTLTIALRLLQILWALPGALAPYVGLGRPNVSIVASPA